MTIRLPFTPPFRPDSLFGHLAATAVPGCEEHRDRAYRRTLRLPNGNGIVALTPRPDHVACELVLDDPRDEPAAIAACRRLLDLDVDPSAFGEVLGRDPFLAPAVREAPGRRVPGTTDAAELALRAVIGQQVSTAAARTHAARIVAAHGTPIADPHGGLTHVFPSPEQLIELDPSTVRMPDARRRCIVALVGALAGGTIELGPGADRALARRQLAALPGVGPWTVETIAMRALGDPDAFPASDLGVLHAAAQLGIATTPRSLIAHAERWRPWRAYGVQYLWATQDHDINRWPPSTVLP